MSQDVYFLVFIKCACSVYLIRRITWVQMLLNNPIVAAQSTGFHTFGVFTPTGFTKLL